MPEKIVKTKKGYQVKGPDGHVYGTHGSRKEAAAQIAAINASKHARGKGK